MLTYGQAKAKAATELNLAAALRRDIVAGSLPRKPAVSAIRDHLRVAKFLRNYASLVRGIRPTNDSLCI